MKNFFMRMYYRLRRRIDVNHLSAALHLMSEGSESPYIAALIRASQTEYVPPEDPDDMEAHMQNGTAVLLEDGRVFTMTEEGAIHLHAKGASWIRSAKIVEKEITSVWNLRQMPPQRVWGEQSTLPMTGEIQE